MTFFEFLGFLILGWFGLAHLNPNGQNNSIVQNPRKIDMIFVVCAVLFVFYKYHDNANEHWEFAKKYDSREIYCQYAKDYSHSLHADEAEQACNAAMTKEEEEATQRTTEFATLQTENEKLNQQLAALQSENANLPQQVATLQHRMENETNSRKKDKLQKQLISIAETAAQAILNRQTTDDVHCIGDCTNGLGIYTLHISKLGEYAKYVGEFENGQFNGYGIYLYKSGDKYVGEFKDGKANGQGTMTWGNGEKYMGKWKDDQKNGQGTQTFADGKVQTGLWQDGEFIQQDNAPAVH